MLASFSNLKCSPLHRYEHFFNASVDGKILPYPHTTFAERKIHSGADARRNIRQDIDPPASGCGIHVTHLLTSTAPEKTSGGGKQGDGTDYKQHNSQAHLFHGQTIQYLEHGRHGVFYPVKLTFPIWFLTHSLSLTEGSAPTMVTRSS